MIDPKELRIGNWVYSTDKTQTEVEVIELMEDGQDKILTTANFEGSMNGKTTAIPLTEEWLLKFGFKKICNHQPYNKDGIHVYLNGEVPQPFLKYVHQLQNLYFALTGEELEIK